MALIKEQRIIDILSSNINIRAIRVLTDTDNFEKRFEGSISLFFRTLKNSMNSVGSISNRSFFKNLSGCYFSLEETKTFEIIILYDSSISKLNTTQVIIRIKKLLGLNTQIQFGDFSDYETRIREMIGIVRKTQTFGDFYFNNTFKAD
jgi:hypothetical protein